LWKRDLQLQENKQNGLRLVFCIGFELQFQKNLDVAISATVAPGILRIKVEYV